MIFPDDSLTDPFRFRMIYGLLKDWLGKVVSKRNVGRMDDADIIDPPIQLDIADDQDVVTGIELPEITEPEPAANPEGTEPTCVETNKDVNFDSGVAVTVQEEQTTPKCIGSKEVLPEDLVDPEKEERCETPTVEEAPIPEKTVSILDNKPYVKVIEDLFQFSSEMERIGGKSSDDDIKSIAEHVFMRLEEIFERNGLSSINGEKNFDVRRHKPEPVSVVADGAEIAETLSPGWSLDERVMRRAKVRIASAI